MWVCVCMGFVMCGCFDNSVGVLVFTAFCIVFYAYLFLFVTSVRTASTE